MKARHHPAAQQQSASPPEAEPLLDLQAAGAALEEAGYDVTIYDQVEGRRDDVGGTWVVDIDRSGKVTLRATYPTRSARQRQLSLAGRPVQLTNEQRQVVTAVTYIRAAGDVGDVVRQLEILVGSPGS